MGDPSIEFACRAILCGSVEGVWYPEDLIALPGTDWIVVSAMRSVGERGALFGVRADAAMPAREIPWSCEAEAGRVSRAAFDPHGIDVRRVGSDRFELLVVDHGGGEAIDRLIIEVTNEGPVIAAGARIVQPRHTSGNAVAHLPDGGFVMTSMFDPEDECVLQKFANGVATGGVWRWGQDDGWRPLGPPMSGANGIATRRNGEELFISEWAARKVWRLALDGRASGSVEVDFLPDNLRWRKENDLLLAGQVGRPETVFGCEARGDACPLAYAVITIDPDTLQTQDIIRRSQAQAEADGFGGATGALAVGPEMWVGSFTGTRVARFATARD